MAVRNRFRIARLSPLVLVLTICIQPFLVGCQTKPTEAEIAQRKSAYRSANKAYVEAKRQLDQLQETELLAIAARDAAIESAQAPVLDRLESEPEKIDRFREATASDAIVNNLRTIAGDDDLKRLAGEAADEITQVLDDFAARMEGLQQQISAQQKLTEEAKAKRDQAKLKLGELEP